MLGFARKQEFVSRKQLTALIRTGYQLIDVRTPEEFREEHLPNAVNVPLNSLDAHLRLLKNRKLPVVAYCQSGRRGEEVVWRISINY